MWLPARSRTAAFPPDIKTYADPKLSGVGVGVPHPMIVTFGVVDSFAPTAAFHNFLLEQ